MTSIILEIQARSYDQHARRIDPVLKAKIHPMIIIPVFLKDVLVHILYPIRKSRLASQDTFITVIAIIEKIASLHFQFLTPLV